jgi:hypothetical protein
MDALFELLREALALKGNNQAELAKELGVVRSRVSELVEAANRTARGERRRKGEDERKVYPLDTLACLRLIRLTNRLDPQGTLRSINERQAEVADELALLFGETGKTRLTKEERGLHDDLKTLTPTEYSHLRAVIKMLADAKRKGR